MDTNVLERHAGRVVGDIAGDVLFGRNGQLFLARGGHNILEIATGVRLPPPESFAAFRKNIESRYQHAAAAGVPFLHVIFPDKQSVLRDDYVTANPICLGEQHLSQSPSIAGHVYYPLDLLRSEGKTSFLRTDTHLSDRGTIVTVCGLVERILGVDTSDARTRMLDSLQIQRELVGDLGGKLEPAESSIETYTGTTWYKHWLHNNLTGGNNGIVDLYFSPRALYPGRLLWFGDSFGREAARFLSFFFEEVVLLRTPFFHADIFDCIRPTLLVTENVERYLANCLPDEDRPSFFMYPHIAGITYEPSQDFARAFSAILSASRSPYTAFKAGMYFKTSAAIEYPKLPATSQALPLGDLPPRGAQIVSGIVISEKNRELAESYGVPHDIHPEDFIFRYVRQRHQGNVDSAVTNYLELGRYSANLAKETVAEIARIKGVAKQSWRPARMLDFASGFGCVSRHLTETFPESQLATCDIHPAAVTFNRNVLRVGSYQSSAVPEALEVLEQDVIFAMSFFSHLPMTTYARWLRALAEKLAPDGALVFTANGHATHALGVTGVEVGPDGFGFQPRSEQTDLDGGEYGITISYPAWVLRTLAAEVPGLRLAYFREGHWWAIQDTYICVRNG